MRGDARSPSPPASDIRAGTDCKLRFTFLDDALFAAFGHAFLKFEFKTQIRLRRCRRFKRFGPKAMETHIERIFRAALPDDTTMRNSKLRVVSSDRRRTHHGAIFKLIRHVLPRHGLTKHYHGSVIKQLRHISESSRITPSSGVYPQDAMTEHKSHVRCTRLGIRRRT